MNISTGPCEPWDWEPFLCEPLECDTGMVDALASIAVSWLFTQTGRRFTGRCRALLRPCIRSCGCNTGCNSCNYRAINLRDFIDWRLPNVVVESVDVDGTPLVNPGAWRQDNYHLVFVDGTPMPTTQDLSLTLGSVGTWSINYSYGVEPPAEVLAACAELVSELCKMCSQSDDCAIPSNAVQVDLPGMRLSLGVDAIKQLPLVSMALEAWPRHPPRSGGGRVYSRAQLGGTSSISVM